MKRGIFSIVIGFQVLFLLLMSISYYVIDDVGEVVKLRTAPVDPPDLFYGDYVRLRYEAELIPANKWFVKEDVEYGDKVYVVLIPTDDGTYEVKSASTIKPSTAGNEVMITAKYEYEDINRSERVNFGLDRFFIEENTGEDFERGPMIATVAIAPWGMKKILSLEPVQ